MDNQEETLQNLHKKVNKAVYDYWHVILIIVCAMFFLFAR